MTGFLAPHCFHEDLDLAHVRKRLALVTHRGFHRKQDLAAKLDSLLRNRDDEKRREYRRLRT